MTTLITGASGRLGSDVLDFLLKWNGPTNLVATSRKAANSPAFQEKDVQFRVVDFDKPETLSAFNGVEKLFLISTDSFDNEARFQSQKRAIDAAVTAKVGHLYYTSGGWGGYGSSKVFIQQAHLQTEEYLKKCVSIDETYIDRV
jgi:NAD(P)H dehydrogenase (quinone)